MSDLEGHETEEEVEEEVVQTRRCTKCHRPLTKHPRPTGRKCELDELEGEALKTYEKNLLETLRKEEKQREKEAEEKTRRNANKKKNNEITVNQLLESLNNLNQNDQSTSSSGSQLTMMESLQQLNNLVQNIPVAAAAGRTGGSGGSGGQTRTTQNQTQQEQGRQAGMMFYQQPIPVPVFSRDMTVESWGKKLVVWNEVHEKSISESMRMSMILDSLKANTERKNLKSWIINNIEEARNRT